MNRKTLFAALACALLIVSMLGCGQTNDLQSIQLSTSNTSEALPGTLQLSGIGAQIQLYAWGNYSDGKQKLLNAVGDVAYQVVVTADNPYAVDPSSGSFYPLPTPPETISLSTNGLLTAVEPSACTWYNSNAGTAATSPAWSVVGTYSATVTYSGLTSPPVFIVMASAPGVYDSDNNPSGECGPPPAN